MMKRFIGLSLFFAGVVFIVFILNLIFYVYNPIYHAALEAAVNGTDDSHIPVVNVNKADITEHANVSELEADEIDAKSISLDYKEPENPEVPLSDTIIEIETETQGDEPLIIDKEYHEDCGTGEGYWIIKYEDGSVKIE